MISIMLESLKRLIRNRDVYFKRIISVMISVAVVISIQCINYNMVKQLSDKNIQKEENITIEVKNKERVIKENELLNDVEITAIITSCGEYMRVISEEWDKADICEFDSLPQIQLTAVTSGYIVQSEEKLLAGRVLNKNDEEYGIPRIMIPNVISNKIFGNESAVGRKLQLSTNEHGIVEVEVIGVYEVDESHNNQTEDFVYDIYINYSYLEKYNMIENKNSEMLEYYVSVNNTDTIKKMLQQYFVTKYRDTETEFVITNDLDEVNKSDKIIELVMNIIQAFAVIAFVISNIGIMNLALMDIEKRIKELGIRMAVGAETKHIFVQIITEGTFLSFVGALGGIVSGFIFGSIINIYIYIKYRDIISSFIFYMPWTAAIYSAVGSLLIGLAFSIIPAKKACNDEIIKTITMSD